MSMRDKIADIIYDNVECVAHPEDAADAILAALPDMIAPLVWEAPCQQNNRCHIARTRFGDYYVDVCGGASSSMDGIPHQTI
jgi:hypothetical protein